MLAKNWKKETARDLIALGSIPFLILVIVRVAMVANFKIIFHVIVATGLVYISSLKFKKINHHLARMMILIIFTSYYYASYLYTVFAILVGIGATYGTHTYLKQKKTLFSVVIGLISSILSYLIELSFNIPNL